MATDINFGGVKLSDSKFAMFVIAAENIHFEHTPQ